MIKQTGSVAAGALLLALVGCNQEQPPAAEKADVELTTQQQKVSYLIGHDVAVDWSARGVHLDAKAVALGILDVAAKKERLSKEEIQAVLQTFQNDQLARQQEMMEQQQQLQAQAEAQFNQQAEENLVTGQAFLAENAGKDGVITTDSGLQYKVLASGEGATPGAADTVEVHYRGTLLDGTEFDSSIKRGVPASFQVNQVIPGWTEALQLMKEGDKWQLSIPSELAYGPGGTGNIPPNAVLQFDVELLKVASADNNEQSAEKE
ncbi:FKBP-type peptidyl-prolyl cis-trans isomerase [Porticoccus sp. W117]|nr:FKBP-type peptidyl-prolyl cis-trans isomerase [Porticoccus sp. W117]